MIPDEAKLLKPGDKVLVEAEVTLATTGEPPYLHVTRSGNVAMKSASAASIGEMFYAVAPEAIREKLPTPSRKFRMGDIVSYDAVYYVIEDQSRFGVLIDKTEDAEYGHMVDAADLSLLCAAENREDRKEDA